MSDSERTALKIKRQMHQQNKAFKAAQKQNRPKLNRTKSLEEFGEYAETTAKALSSLALKVMSLQTAFGYAESMIRLDIDGEGVEWDTKEAFKVAERIENLLTAKILFHHFSVPKSIANGIINQMILKQFGPAVATNTALPVPPPNNGIPTFSASEVRQMLEQHGKKIDKGKP